MPGRGKKKKKKSFYGKFKYCVWAEREELWSKRKWDQGRNFAIFNQKNWEEIGIFS